MREEIVFAGDVVRNLHSLKSTLKGGNQFVQSVKGRENKRSNSSGSYLNCQELELRRLKMINVGIHLQLGRKIKIVVHSSGNTTHWVSIENDQDICDEINIFFRTREQAEDVARALRGESIQQPITQEGPNASIDPITNPI